MSLCQVSFRAESIGNALAVYRGLFTLQTGINYIYIYAFIYIAICVAAHVYAAVVYHSDAHYLLLDYKKFSSWLLLWLVLLLTLVFFYVGGSAFVYLQF